MSDAFRLAMIGTGNISRAHRRAMAELKAHGLDDFVVSAVCDVNEEAAEYAAREASELFGRRPTVYTDYQQLLSKEEMDGADLCLPLGWHHVVAIACLEAGVPVLCEKPLGITIKAARQMAEAAERAGRILSTAHQSRRQPGPRAAHWAINQAQLMGEPRAFFHQHATMPWRPPAEGSAAAGLPSLTPPWQRQPRQRTREERLLISGGGPLVECGVHYFDTMRYLLGDVDTVYAQVRSLEPEGAKGLEEAIENAVFATITLKSGVVGTWSYWLAAPGEAFTNVVFYGSQGSLRDSSQGRYRGFCHLFAPDSRVDAVESGRLVQAHGAEIFLAELERMHLASLSDEERERLFPRGIQNGMAIEIWEFIEAVRGNRDGVEVDGWGGIKSLAGALAIYESAVTGDVIPVDDVLSGERAVYQEPMNEHWKL